MADMIGSTLLSYYADEVFDFMQLWWKNEDKAKKINLFIIQSRKWMEAVIQIRCYEICHNLFGKPVYYNYTSNTGYES